MEKTVTKLDWECEQIAALPWRKSTDGEVRILLVTSRTNAKWMLPKGWPIKGKSDAETALVEASEEAGIDGQVSDAPIGSYFYLKLYDDGRAVPSQAVVYPIRVTSVAKKWDEKKQRSRRWMRPKKAAEMAFEPDLKRFLSDLDVQALSVDASASSDLRRE